MMVEIKTMGASLTPAQKDTLHIINQITRNRKQTPTKELKWQSGDCNVSKVLSVVSNKEVYLRAYGAHVLTFSGLGPSDSEWMTWDKKNIGKDDLTALLRFDYDPDVEDPTKPFKPLDLRYHHIYRIDRQPSLFDFNVSNKTEP